MEPNPYRGKVTSIVTAFARAYHFTHDHPLIFADTFAPALFTDAEHVGLAHGIAQSGRAYASLEEAAGLDDAEAGARFLRVPSTTVTLPRSRYAEACLEAALAEGVRNYVILGAGLDTFAYRRPDLVDRLAIYEVDHPETRADKRERLARLGQSWPANLHLVACDFASQPLDETLGRAGFDRSKPTFVSWLGVSYYLTHDAFEATLRRLAKLCPPGSRLVFDFLEPQALDPARAAPEVAILFKTLARLGEPFQSTIAPADLASTLTRLGFELVETLTPEAIQGRYFAGRSDGYRAFEHIHFAHAVVCGVSM